MCYWNLIYKFVDLLLLWGGKSFKDKMVNFYKGYKWKDGKDVGKLIYNMKEVSLS